MSGSGKDTILDILTLNKYEPIISYTTRSPRHYEKDGIAYHFITEQQFKELDAQGFFVEQTIYRNWHYGIAKKDCHPGRVVVVEPNGLAQLQQVIKDIVVIFVQTSEENRYKRLIKRGDELKEIERRIYSDRKVFAGMKEKSHIVIDNNGDMQALIDKIPTLISILVNSKYQKDQVLC